MGTSFCTKAAFVISGLIALGAGTLNAQSVEIARWKNNATAAYSIIMDDYATQYFGDVAHIDSTLANRNLGVSFATIPNWAECTGGCLKGAFGRAQTLFKNSEWINHSWAHSNTTAEDNALNFDQAKAKIEEGIPGNKCLVFAYPSTMNFSDNHSAYIRSKEYIGCRTNKAGDGINHYAMADPFQLKSPFFSGGDLSTLQTFVDNAISEGGYGVKSCHNVGSGGWAPIPRDMWTAHLDYVDQKIKARQLWMGTVQDIIKYSQEREHFQVNISTTSATELSVTFITDAEEINPSPVVSNALYDEFLTLLVTLSGGFEGVTVSQGGQTLPHTTGNATIMFDADPWGGAVTISAGDVGISRVSLQTQRSAQTSGNTMYRLDGSKVSDTQLKGKAFAPGLYVGQSSSKPLFISGTQQ